MYRNSEGYASPVEGAVMSKLMHEYKQKQRQIWQRRNEIKSRPKVYIVSRYAGDVEKNVAAAIRYSKFTIDQGCIPVVSHLLYPRIVNDNDPAERELGMMFGQALLDMCDAVWVFGTDFSEGMQQEVHEAKRIGKKIRYFTEMMEEKHEND